jgi:tripartite-type tricarboxylate transporter receptor subunit TctC
MIRKTLYRRSALGLAVALLLSTPFAGVHAQAFPNRPVTLVVPFPPGGGPDLAARLLAEKMAPKLGQPVVVENRPGAGALVGAAHVARSAADGHTLLFTPNTVVISPHVLPAGAGGGVDVQKDLMPVIAPATTPLAVLAHPSLGVKNLKELAEAARKTPGIPYGSAGNGSPMHFAGEMFKQSAKVDLLHVPYRGVAPSVASALAGEVKVLFVPLGGALQHIQAERLVPLALTESGRSSLRLDLSTAGEQGFANVEVNAWYGVFAPTGTPAATVARLNQEFNDALKLQDVRDRLKIAGLDVLGGESKVLADFVKNDSLRYGTLARDLNIKAD